MLGATAVPVSHALLSGKGRRYRRHWRENSADIGVVDRLFEQGVTSALFDLRRFDARKCREYEIIRGDARACIGNLGEADLVVFSPPYPNSFDYTDVYNIELWMLGYLSSAADNRSLRESTLRSHVQIRRCMEVTHRPGPLLQRVLDALNAVRLKLWDSAIPDMIGAYFDDMSAVLEAIRTRLKPGGRAYMVVGDSRYRGVDIPVAAVLEEEATDLGFDVVDVELFRSRRASPQQGGRAELVETLIVLRRPHE
jgi:hypothetical protein